MVSGSNPVSLASGNRQAKGPTEDVPRSGRRSGLAPTRYSSPTRCCSTSGHRHRRTDLPGRRRRTVPRLGPNRPADQLRSTGSAARRLPRARTATRLVERSRPGHARRAVQRCGAGASLLNARNAPVPPTARHSAQSRRNLLVPQLFPRFSSANTLRCTERLTGVCVHDFLGSMT